MWLGIGHDDDKRHAHNDEDGNDDDGGRDDDGDCSDDDDGVTDAYVDEDDDHDNDDNDVDLFCNASNRDCTCHCDATHNPSRERMAKGRLIMVVASMWDELCKATCLPYFSARPRATPRYLHGQGPFLCLCMARGRSLGHQ